MVIADIVTTGGGARNVASPALLAASSELPMPSLSETRLPDLVRVEKALPCAFCFFSFFGLRHRKGSS
jgi:hypothetical protein